MALAEALSRTTLLMRADLVAEAPEHELIETLTSTRAVLCAGRDVLRTHSGQTAVVAAALMMARSGHEVWLDMPDTEILGAQPPLTGERLPAALMETGMDLLPTRTIAAGQPAGRVDLEVIFGAASGGADAAHRIWLTADDWSASLSTTGEWQAWQGGEWPIGGLAAGSLAAGEVFKCSMRRLAGHALAPGFFARLYAPAADTQVQLAPREAPLITALPHIDMISGGAIANAAIFTLLRLPGVTGAMRVFDDDESAFSNLNRNQLLRRSRLGIAKVEDLASFGGGLAISPIPHRYDEALAAGIRLADFVLVGVDDIPSRWAVEKAATGWVGVGATSAYMAMASHHHAGVPCSGCLHPVATDLSGPIPTVAFVSFWSGLLLATAVLRRLAGAERQEQQSCVIYPLRPEALYASSVMANAACPVGCSSAAVAARGAVAV